MTILLGPPTCPACAVFHVGPPCPEVVLVETARPLDRDPAVAIWSELVS